MAATASADLLFDQGASTGNLGGSWSNETSSQNFLDKVTLGTTSMVTDYTYYTSFDPSTFGTMHVKLYSDSGGLPGSVIDTQDLAVSSFYSTLTADSQSVTAVELNLTTPWILNAGTTYWVGASGNGFEAAQISLLSPGDGHMAQFGGTTYSFMTAVGDQAFQLHGSAVPEPASMAALGLGALALLRRKKAR